MATGSENVRPTSLRREGDGLKIDWSDGKSTFIRWTYLRKMCPCAGCIEERNKPADPFKILSPQEIAAGAPQPVSMQAKGYYAYQIIWNDGHDTGIYSVSYLRKLSEQDQ